MNINGIKANLGYVHICMLIKVNNSIIMVYSYVLPIWKDDGFHDPFYKKGRVSMRFSWCYRSWIPIDILIIFTYYHRSSFPLVLLGLRGNVDREWVSSFDNSCWKGLHKVFEFFFFLTISLSKLFFHLNTFTSSMFSSSL